MAEEMTLPGDASALRFRAEAMARADATLWPENISPLAREEVQRMLHELRVHQIELEMQNEELRRTQVELADSKASYVDLYDFAPVGYFTVSERGVILKANLTAAGLLGIPRSALVRAQFSRFIVPEDEGVYYLHRNQFFATGGPHLCELRFVRKDSSLFWALLEATAAQDADGMPVSHVVMSDITERKQKEEELARSQAELKTIYDHAPAMLCLIDSERRILHANPAFAAFTGRSKSNLNAGRVAGPLPGCVHALDDSGGCGYGSNCGTCALRLALEDTVRTGLRQDNIEFPVTVLLDGAQRIVTLLASLAAVPGAGSRRVLLCLTDITERKRSEKEKEKLTAQLIQAQKMESVGRLAGGVAHDFNNLLTVINGYSSFLVAGLRAHDPLRRFAEHISTAGEHAASLTKQLLAFSRNQVIEPKALDLNKTIRDALPMLQRLIGEDIKVTTHLDGTLGVVMADPDQVYQVIMNLLVNARDAMHDCGKFDIRTANVEVDEEGVTALGPDATPGRCILMTVTDTGHGMDTATCAQIFEPFFTTKEVSKGTGLGLSTVYGIIRQSNGWITVQSEVGVGTSFSIYLPRIDACPPPEEERIEAPGEKRSGTVLLVEDREPVRTFTKAVLEQDGYHVIEASDGEEAVVLAREHPGQIHLLLTDVVLPRMNGRDLADRLKVLLPPLKVLFISGFTADVIAKRGVLDPDVVLLQKPFSPAALTAKVREILMQEPQ